VKTDNLRLCSFHVRTTLFLRVLFLIGQYFEYTEAAFTISDSVFGRTFYLTTGFHGFHVLIGALY
jgi:cytochrome c oxidase subunit 3